MANVSNASGVFVGIDELHLIKGGFGDGFTVPTGKTLTEVPVAEESGFSYTGGTPSTERYRIHGLTAPWAIKMTPGDAEVSVFIPQITQALLEMCGFTVTASQTATVAGKSWSGITWQENATEVILGVAAINRTDDQLLGIKKIQVMASIVFDDANSAKPVGIQLTGASTGGTDADAIGLFSLAASSN